MNTSRFCKFAMRSRSFADRNKTAKDSFARTNHGGASYEAYTSFCKQTISEIANSYLGTYGRGEIVSHDEIKILTDRLLEMLEITPNAF